MRLQGLPAGADIGVRPGAARGRERGASEVSLRTLWGRPGLGLERAPSLTSCAHTHRHCAGTRPGAVLRLYWQRAHPTRSQSVVVSSAGAALVGGCPLRQRARMHGARSLDAAPCAVGVGCPTRSPPIATGRTGANWRRTAPSGGRSPVDGGEAQCGPAGLCRRSASMERPPSAGYARDLLPPAALAAESKTSMRCARLLPRKCQCKTNPVLAQCQRPAPSKVPVPAQCLCSTRAVPV